MKRFTLLCVLCGLPFVIGCAGDSENTTATPVPEATLAALRQADQLDGTEDHVIGKCYVCNLGMDGKAEHAVEVHGYTAHLCSSSCKDHFAESSNDVIANTAIPNSQ